METRLLHRKDGLVLTTIELIHEKGFQGLSTREIARREGISEAAIFKHFSSKKELILAVLEYFSQYDEAIIVAVGSREQTPYMAIIDYIDLFVSYYENYPEITAILHSYESLILDKSFSEKAKSIYAARKGFLQSLVAKAIARGDLSAATSEELTDILVGSVRVINLQWRMSDYAFPLKERTITIVKTILQAFACA